MTIVFPVKHKSGRTHFRLVCRALTSCLSPLGWIMPSHVTGKRPAHQKMPIFFFASLDFYRSIFSIFLRATTRNMTLNYVRGGGNVLHPQPLYQQMWSRKVMCVACGSVLILRVSILNGTVIWSKRSTALFLMGVVCPNGRNSLTFTGAELTFDKTEKWPPSFSMPNKGFNLVI